MATIEEERNTFRYNGITKTVEHFDNIRNKLFESFKSKNIVQNSGSIVDGVSILYNYIHANGYDDSKKQIVLSGLSNTSAYIHRFSDQLLSGFTFNSEGLLQNYIFKQYKITNNSESLYIGQSIEGELLSATVIQKETSSEQWKLTTKYYDINQIHDTLKSLFNENVPFMIELVKSYEGKTSFISPLVSSYFTSDMNLTGDISLELFKNTFCSQFYHSFDNSSSMSNTHYIIKLLNQQINKTLQSSQSKKLSNLIDNDAVFAIFSNCNFYIKTNQYYDKLFKDKNFLQCIKFDNTTVTVNVLDDKNTYSSMFENDFNLQQLPSGFELISNESNKLNDSNLINCESLFKNCYSLKKIPASLVINNVGSIQSICENCSSLIQFNATINLKYSTNFVNSIFLSSFYNCQKLKNIDSINTTELTVFYPITSFQQTFYNCNQLQTFPNLNLNGSLSSSIQLFRNHKKLKSIPESYLSNLSGKNNTNININGLLSGCESLTEIPTTLKNIIQLSTKFNCESLFENCYSLKENDLVIGNNTTLSAHNMFKNCYSLTGITLNLSDASNLNNICEGCSGLLNATVNRFSANSSAMFKNCYSLNSVSLTGRSLTANYDSLFENCSSLYDINIYNKLYPLTMASGFAGCRSISNFKPNLILRIENNTKNLTHLFKDCVNLQIESQNALEIKSNNTIIYGMFQGCTRLSNNYHFSIDTSKLKGTHPTLTDVQNYLNSKNVKNIFDSESPDFISGYLNVPYSSPIFFNALLTMNCDNLFKDCKSLLYQPLSGTISSMNSTYQGCSNIRFLHPSSVLFVSGLLNSEVKFSNYQCQDYQETINRLIKLNENIEYSYYDESYFLRVNLLSGLNNPDINVESYYTFIKNNSKSLQSVVSNSTYNSNNQFYNSKTKSQLYIYYDSFFESASSNKTQFSINQSLKLESTVLTYAPPTILIKGTSNTLYKFEIMKYSDGIILRLNDSQTFLNQNIYINDFKFGKIHEDGYSTLLSASFNKNKIKVFKRLLSGGYTLADGLGINLKQILNNGSNNNFSLINLDNQNISYIYYNLKINKIEVISSQDKNELSALIGTSLLSAFQLTLTDSTNKYELNQQPILFLTETHNRLGIILNNIPGYIDSILCSSKIEFDNAELSISSQPISQFKLQTSKKSSISIYGQNYINFAGAEYENEKIIVNFSNYSDKYIKYINYIFYDEYPFNIHSILTSHVSSTITYFDLNNTYSKNSEKTSGLIQSFQDYPFYKYKNDSNYLIISGLTNYKPTAYYLQKSYLNKLDIAGSGLYNVINPTQSTTYEENAYLKYSLDRFPNYFKYFTTGIVNYYQKTQSDKQNNNKKYISLISGIVSGKFDNIQTLSPLSSSCYSIYTLSSDFTTKSNVQSGFTTLNEKYNRYVNQQFDGLTYASVQLVKKSNNKYQYILNGKGKGLYNNYNKPYTIKRTFDFENNGLIINQSQKFDEFKQQSRKYKFYTDTDLIFKQQLITCYNLLYPKLYTPLSELSINNKLVNNTIVSGFLKFKQTNSNYDTFIKLNNGSIIFQKSIPFDSSASNLATNVLKTWDRGTFGTFIIENCSQLAKIFEWNILSDKLTFKIDQKTFKLIILNKSNKIIYMDDDFTVSKIETNGAYNSKDPASLGFTIHSYIYAGVDRYYPQLNNIITYRKIEFYVDLLNSQYLNVRWTIQNENNYTTYLQKESQIKNLMSNLGIIFEDQREQNRIIDQFITTNQMKVQSGYIYDGINKIYAFIKENGNSVIYQPNGYYQNINVENCTSYINTFKGCTKLLDIPSGFLKMVKNTAAGLTHKGMFEGCQNLKNDTLNELGICGFFDNSKNLSRTFKDCYQLTEINSNFNFPQDYVSSYCSTFQNCSGLTSIDSVINVNKGNNVDLSNMFKNCISLKFINSFSTGFDKKASNCSGMFENCYSLENIPNITLKSGIISGNKITGCSVQNMFKNCQRVQIITINSNLFENSKSYQNTFANCINLRNLKINGNLNQNVENINNMFYNCSNLLEIPEKLKTSNVKYCNSTFENCYLINKLNQYLGNYYAFSNAIEANNLFKNCRSLSSVIEKQSIDDLNANASAGFTIDIIESQNDSNKIMQFSYSNNDSSNLEKYISDKIDILKINQIKFIKMKKNDQYYKSIVENLSNSTIYDDSLCSIISSELLSYNNYLNLTSDNISSYVTGNLSSDWSELSSVFFNQSLISAQLDTNNIITSYYINDNISSIILSGLEINGFKYNSKLLPTSSNVFIKLNNDHYNTLVSSLLSGFYIQYIKILTNDKDFQLDFNNCSISGFTIQNNIYFYNKNQQFDLSKCISCKSMFEGCKQLSMIYSSINLNSIQNCSRMFKQCLNLESVNNEFKINLSNSCQDISQMFYGCKKIISIDGLITNSILYFTNTFYGCTELKEIKSPLSFSNAINLNNIFYGCKKLQTFSFTENSLSINFDFSNIYSNVIKDSQDTNKMDILLQAVVDLSDYGITQNISFTAAINKLGFDVANNYIQKFKNKNWIIQI